MDNEIDWTIVQPERKWQLLRRLPRFAFWAVYTSVGSMMLGNLVPPRQEAAFLTCLGFDFGVAGTATAMPAFQQKFGIPYPSQPSGYLIPATWQSAWSGASTGGDVLGIFIGGQVADIIGRKPTLGIGTILTAAGIGVQMGSHDWKVFLVRSCAEYTFGSC